MPEFDLDRLTGKIVIVAPHMDDEALACGGLIARLPNKDKVHIIYATDGMKSPAPILPGHDKISAYLGKTRMQESIEAMKTFGVSEENLHFLWLPEAELKKHFSALRNLLGDKIREIAPTHILVPFRYDRHPDHLAVNHAVVSELKHCTIQAELIEYFVYYRWRLLSERDVRKYLKPGYLFRLNISNVANQKRKALDCFTSQTTIYYSWQTRPILRSALLDEECQNPEYFLISNNSWMGTAVFSSSVFWIRLVHRLEPFLQRWKYQIGATLKRLFQNDNAN